ncbi:MAG: ATP-binding protein [Acidobacteriota bacterium]
MSVPATAQTRRLQAIIESSHDAIIGCDLAGVIRHWNPAARTLYGYRPDEAVGQSLDLLTDAEGAGELPRILERLAAGERFEHYETVHHRRDGSAVAVSLSISLLELDDAEMEASLIVRDMTARRQAEAEVRQAHRELETLIGTVAHEMRSPIFGARGLVQMLRASAAPPTDLETYLERFESNLNFSDRFLDGLAAIAEARGADRRPAAVDPGQLVEELAHELRSGEPTRELSFTVAADFPQLWCQPAALRQILHQLLTNAIQFDARGAVEIDVGWTARGEDKVAILVRDRGPGIPRGEHDRIFDMFYRGHGPAQRGPGLGLALVKRLSEAMGGQVAVESKVGAGSTFWVTLPSAGPGRSTLSVTKPAVSKPAASKPTVDDTRRG